jgi:di/tricarboxylate transporter
LALFVAMIFFLSTGLIPGVIAVALAAALMVGTGCLSPGDARRSVEWQVLTTIAAAFGIGAALEKSGAAETIARGIVDLTTPLGPIAAVAAIYLLTALITEMITNNAAAVLAFPFCLKTAEIYDASPTPFIMALILAASASFITPIGYQTNMMVFGPGGYRFTDFIRIGAPLSFTLWITATILIPIIWPF